MDAAFRAIGRGFVAVFHSDRPIGSGAIDVRFASLRLLNRPAMSGAIKSENFAR